MLLLAAAAAAALDAPFLMPTLRGAHAGALVVDTRDGRVVYARNADDAFVPASTFKLIVGSAALDLLPPDTAFVTTLATDGTTAYLIGGGELDLNAKDAAEAARVLAEQRATAFPGGLVADDTRYSANRYPDGWQIDDLAYDYGAPPRALDFDHNTATIAVAPAASEGDPAVLTAPPSLAVTGAIATGAKASEDTSGFGVALDAPYTLRAFGTVPLASQAQSVDVALLDPARFALAAFARAFDAAHIDYGGTSRAGSAPAGARMLWQHRSPPLAQEIAAMWIPSDNTLAETLLLELGVHFARTHDARADGIDAERQWLRGLRVDMQHLTVADGSGLSSYDRITPRALTAILLHDWNGSQRATVLASLPVAGETGTLRDAFATTPLRGKVIAKTGTVNHVRTLAGYLETGATTYAFALMVDDWADAAPGAGERLRAAQAAFLEALLP